VSAKKERAVFDHYWADELGELALAEVRSSEVRAKLASCAEGRTLGQHGERLKRKSIGGVRAVLLQLFDSAWQDELVSENPVARVKLKSVCPNESTKTRTLLTDAEFGQLLASHAVGPELKMLALLARTIGGQRTSDLHSLDWTAFGPAFATLRVPRHKTRSTRGAQELDVPEQVRPFVEVWWRALGSPKVGPVFPCRKGKRVGRAKSLRNSYAAELREALHAAGVRRHVCDRKPDAEPRKRGEACCPAMATDPLFTDTTDTLRVDFHRTTRGGYSTALAAAGVNVQTAMVLTGHSSPQVHQRYIAEATIRALPPAALPPMPSAPVGSEIGNGVAYLDPSDPSSLANFPWDFLAPAAGLEPATRRLTAACSTD
jgi:integrase